MESLKIILADDLFNGIKAAKYDPIEFVERLSVEGEELLSSLMAFIFHPVLIVSGSTGTKGFKFSSTSLLWVECDVREELKINIPRTLYPFILSCTEYINSIAKADPESESTHRILKSLSRLQKLKDTVMTDVGKGRIANSAYPHLRQPNFADELNKFSDLLPLKGGNIINIRTKEIRKRTITDLFTRELPVFYDGNAGPLLAKVEKTISDIMLDKPERVKFMKQLCGYFISSDNKKQLFFIFYGDGSNGKGTLFQMFEQIFSGLITNPPIELIEQAGKKVGLKKDYIYELDGKRLMFFSELDEGKSGKLTLNEAQIKRFTGEDKFSADAKYKGVKEFYVTAKPVIACNDYPVLSGSKAINRRARLVPFEASFVYEPKDANERLRDDSLTKTFATEEFKTAFFHYCLEGYADFLRNGEDFDTPADFIALEQEYKANANSLLQFIELLEDSDKRIQAKELFNTYKLWCNYMDHPQTITQVSQLGTTLKGGARKFKNSISGGVTFYYAKLREDIAKEISAGGAVF